MGSCNFSHFDENKAEGRLAYRANSLIGVRCCKNAAGKGQEGSQKETLVDVQ